MHSRFLALLGKKIAPPRFLLFGGTLAVAFASAGMHLTDLRIALLLAFDVAALVFLTSILPLLNDDAHTMRRVAQMNDANRPALLALTVLLSVVMLLAIGTLIASKTGLHWQVVALIVGTLALSWTFANTVFALHYAHLYYLPELKGDRRGLEVPHTDHPNYGDFLYFSFTLGMTFQTSDITISGRHMRKVALLHSMAAFLFNMGILAFTVNALGGL